MVTIKRAAFSVSWTTTYPSILDGSSTGNLAFRGGYVSLFGRGEPALTMPWVNKDDLTHWSSFWARYLGAPEKLRHLTADSAWDRVVPFMFLHGNQLTGSAAVDANAEVLIYPAAISVIVRVDVAGSWALDELASSLFDIRRAKDWAVKGAGSQSTQRNLDGIATDLRNEAVKWLSAGAAPQPGAPRVFTVATPTLGEGDEGSLALTDDVARSCLAGLASLGPPGTLDDKRLLDLNSDSKRKGRVYWVSDGHAIWHPTYVINHPKRDSLECLLRNQTDVVAHIAALAGTASWANDQIAANVAVPAATIELVQRSVKQLNLLHEGDTLNTYRSGIARVRLEPMLPKLAAVKQVFG